jgi:hypothetical protein
MYPSNYRWSPSLSQVRPRNVASTVIVSAISWSVRWSNGVVDGFGTCAVLAEPAIKFAGVWIPLDAEENSLPLAVHFVGWGTSGAHAVHASTYPWSGKWPSKTAAASCRGLPNSILGRVVARLLTDGDPRGRMTGPAHGWSGYTGPKQLW